MKTVRATEYIETMFQGRSRSQLVLASDGKKYVVKLVGNPQGTRILANECVAAGLAEALGAPCVPSAIIEIDDEILSQINRKMQHLLPAEHLEFRPGLHFGSLYLGLGWPFPSRDPVQILPSTVPLMSRTSNISTWPETLVFYALVQNEDPRHEHILVELEKASGASRYWLIDHGHCLGVGRGWRTLKADSVALREPIYPELVRGHEPFREALERLGEMTAVSVEELLASCPLQEWEVSREDQAALLRYIEAAKEKVRSLISESRPRFSAWT